MGERIPPTAGTAIAVALLYTAAFISIPVVSGIEYADWFDSAENAARTGIAGLAAGSAVLLAFLVLARWDLLWRDPARLPMSGLLWTPPLLFALVIVVRLVGIEWSLVPARLLLAIVTAGVLVLIGVLIRAFMGHFSSRSHFGVEGSVLYWHFVDVVWLALYATLYAL